MVDIETACYIITDADETFTPFYNLKINNAWF